MPTLIDPEEASAISEAPAAERKPYGRPRLKRHGNVHELTKAEYGGLDALIHGSLFAMTSPGLPPGPSR